MSGGAIHCPCCGQAWLAGLPWEPLELVRSLPAGQRMRALLEELARRPGQWVPTSRLVLAMWADEASGGPLDAPAIVRVRVAQVRPMLRGYGLVIEGRVGSGYRLVMAARAEAA